MRLRQFLPSSGFPAPTTDSGLDELFAVYVKGYEAAWTAFPDAAPALRRLKENGLTIGIVTNGNHLQQAGKITRIGIEPLVDRIFCSELMGHAKPSPEAFLVPCQEMQFSPARACLRGCESYNGSTTMSPIGVRSTLIGRKRQNGRQPRDSASGSYTPDPAEPGSRAECRRRTCR